MLGPMSLPDHILEAARLAYHEGRLSEDRLDDIACYRRLKRFERFGRSKLRQLTEWDKRVLAEHAAFFSIYPHDPELNALAQATIEAWESNSPYRGSFGLGGTPVDTAEIISHYLSSTGAQEGPRHRTRNFRLSTAGLDQAARILKPYMPTDRAWTVTGGAYTRDGSQAVERTPSKAEDWLLKQMHLIEPALRSNLPAAQGIIREVIIRTNLGR